MEIAFASSSHSFLLGCWNVLIYRTTAKYGFNSVVICAAFSVN